MKYLIWNRFHILTKCGIDWGCLIADTQIADTFADTFCCPSFSTIEWQKEKKSNWTLWGQLKRRKMLLANFFTNAFLIGGGGCSSIGFHHHHAHHVRMDNNNCKVSQLISSSTITLPISTTTTALSLSSKRNDNNNESSILKTAFGALQEKDQYGTYPILLALFIVIYVVIINHLCRWC